MYTALYRAERPEVFSEILGQEHIVKILKRQLATDTVSHAYLFCGTRGTGKTTTARILAKAVNCLSEDGDVPCGKCVACKAISEGNFIDVIEIDAASNTGVDSVRELRESVNYPPAVGRKKVYIIDEVHMMSTSAFNALLKTLEEPPENVMFILATTEPQKLPATILSRCMRLDFRRVPQNTLADAMERICGDKGVSIDESALRLLASNADGSVRDGLSLLDQCLSTGEPHITRDTVLEFLGTESEEFFIDLTEYVSLHYVSEALLKLDEVISEGKDVKQLMKDWMSHYRNLLITKYVKNPQDMLNMSSENIERLREQSERISVEEIDSGIVTLSKTINDARYSTQPRILMELAIVTLASGLGENNIPQRPAVTQAKPVKPAKPVTPAQPSALREPDPRGGKTPAEPLAEKGQAEMGEKERQQLWHDIFEEGEGTKSSFNIVRISTTLEKVTDREFVVNAMNELTVKYVEDNRAQIEALMEKKTGRRLHLVCVGAGDNPEQEDNDAEKIAIDLENTFGIAVDIE